MKTPIVSDILQAVTGTVDTCVKNSTDKTKLKAELTKVVFDSYNKLYETERQIITAEVSGNWLQRSWRPIVMLMFACIVVIGMFVDLPLLRDESPFWDLLDIGLGGYVIGRSAEKITSRLTNKLLK